MSLHRCSSGSGGGGNFKQGHKTIPSDTDSVVITDIGFEPTYFAWYVWKDSNTMESGVDDYDNNIHFYCQKNSSQQYVYNNTRITAKSASSITVDSPISALRGQEMYYIALG